MFYTNIWPFVFMVVLLFRDGSAGVRSKRTTWSNWSACSASCGHGIQTRRRFCLHKENLLYPGWKIEEKQSYLGKPRIHFAGEFISDATTANNIRCMYDPEYFCPSCSKDATGFYQLENLTEKGPRTPFYNLSSIFWNNKGGGHFYFQRTFVTASCLNLNEDCGSTDAIVGRKVENPSNARIVDLDVDCQTASTIYGMEVHIPGVFSAKMLPCELTKLSTPGTHSGVESHKILNGVYKSKLTNIQWLDSYYKEKFLNSTEISIEFTVYNYDINTLTGNLVGTIGMTSSDDPVNNFLGRSFKVQNPYLTSNSESPFHFDRASKKITIDLSSVMRCPALPKLNDFLTAVSELTFGLFPSSVNNLEKKYIDLLQSADGLDFFILTSNDELGFLLESSGWFEKYGGIVELDFQDASDYLLDMMDKNRLGFVYKQILHQRKTTSDQDKDYASDAWKVLLIEDEYGINLKHFGYFTKRLSLGESWRFSIAASSFGRPLVGAKIELNILKHSFQRSECIRKNQSVCSPYLAEPKSALRLSEPQWTNGSGLVTFRIDVVQNPGNPRKGGIDGQLYPIGVFLTYIPSNKGIRKNPFRVGVGGMFDSVVSDSYRQRKAKEQCGLDSVYSFSTSVVKVYSSLPESTMRKKCPSWSDDIKSIFYFYFNTAPVMAHHEILNLKDLSDIRSKLNLINMSMFGYGFYHPNFMPVTRDLSPDKTELVRRWIECEMKKEESSEDQINEQRNKSEVFQKCLLSDNFIEESLEKVKDLLQLAIWVELYTIPPYLTAYFSIKLESNRKVKQILKSIFAEEMLHLSLVSNVLNAIGGNPQVNDAYWYPQYPTLFPSKRFIQLKPQLEIKLGKYSKQLVKDIFSEIERPAPIEVLTIIRSIATLGMELAKQEVAERNVDSNQRASTNIEDRMTNWIKDAYNISHTKTKFNHDDADFLESQFEFSSEKLNHFKSSDVDTIGGMYAYIMLHLIQIESCLKMKDRASTIFIGDPAKQLNSKLWYVTKGVSQGILFPVTNLKTALKALLDVCYEGEGGTPCSPFVLTVNGKLSDTSVTNPTSKSHFVKFQELAHGHEIIPMTEKPSSWSTSRCLDHDNKECSCILKNGTVSYSSSSDCLQFCFFGALLDVDEENGVWPLEKLPETILFHLDKKLISDEALKNSHNFDRIYTNLLHCLNDAFNGNPNKMTTCMGKMYELQHAGEKLVRTPITRDDDVSSVRHCLPRWRFVKDPYKNEGLIIDGNKNYEDTETFC